jgi:synaptojanin
MDYGQSFQPAASWPLSVSSPEKASQLLIREYPHRAIAIVSSSHALVFRHSLSTSEAIANGSLTSVASARPRNDGVVSKCMVEFTPLSKNTLQDYRPLTPRPVYGTLGLISVNGDVFLCVVTSASRAAIVRSGESVENIQSVAFFCLSSSEYDDVVSMDSFDNDLPDAVSVYNQNLSRREVTVEHPCHELRKLLSNGSFYYSTEFDVTNRLQDR